MPNYFNKNTLQRYFTGHSVCSVGTIYRSRLKNNEYLPGLAVLCQIMLWVIDSEMVYFSTILYLRFVKLTSRKDRTRGFITLPFETSFDSYVNPFRSMRESLTLVEK